MVEAEAVHAIVLDQEPEVLLEEMNGLRVREVDQRTPRGIALEKAIAGDGPQRVVRRSGMIEDDVEEHGDAVLVTNVDEAFERLGAAVRRFHRVEERRVVTPAVVAGELVHGHQENSRDAEAPQVAAVVAELFRYALERREAGLAKAAGEAPRVQLIHDEIVGARCAPRRRSARGDMR